MEKDIFCKIVANEISSYKVYEDEKVLAFLDVNPIRLGHTLVVPKEHYQYIFDMPNDLYHYLWDVARKLSGVITEAAGSKRTGIAVEGFGVPHVHIHLVPIDEINGLDPHLQHSEPAERLTEMAERIRTLLT